VPGRCDWDRHNTSKRAMTSGRRLAPKKKKGRGRGGGDHPGFWGRKDCQLIKKTTTNNEEGRKKKKKKKLGGKSENRVGVRINQVCE